MYNPSIVFVVLVETDKMMLKFIRKCRGPKSDKVLLKNNKSWRTFMTRYQDVLIQLQ